MSLKSDRADWNGVPCVLLVKKHNGIDTVVYAMPIWDCPESLSRPSWAFIMEYEGNLMPEEYMYSDMKLGDMLDVIAGLGILKPRTLIQDSDVELTWIDREEL